VRHLCCDSHANLLHLRIGVVDRRPDALREYVQRITLAAHALELGAVAILLRVAFVMATEATRQRFDQRGSAAVACPIHGLPNDFLHRHCILAVDHDAGHAIRCGTIGDARD
jgi:hypothetical protein